ncbi:MAG TPA: NfeD family protein [Bacilli bacterium]|nr:NfeD family protein [Bacilli bacterium]HQA55594.1 NfeD family protein [Bacilli bacterium]
MEQYLWIIWLAIFVLAIVVESLSADLTSIWFAFGSIIALIISFIPGVAWWVQLIIFLVISILTLLCLRPLAKRLLKRNIVSSNIDEMAGKKGIMIKGYDELNRGEVKINDVIWTAINVDESAPIPAGTKVVVIAVNGNKLIVRSIDQE